MGRYRRAIQFFCNLDPTMLGKATAQLARVGLLPKNDPTVLAVLQYLSKGSTAGPRLSRFQEKRNSPVDLSLNRAPEPWEEGQLRLLRMVKSNSVSLGLKGNKGQVQWGSELADLRGILLTSEGWD